MANNKQSPDLIAFAVTGTDDNPFYNKIGAAWENKDGSMNLNFDFLPTDPSATIQLRPLKED